MQATGIKERRELEDQLIECFQLQLLKGKLDQREQRLLVESTFGRDVSESDITNMLTKLKKWDS